MESIILPNDPDAYLCQIYYYSASHTQLCIDAFDTSNFFKIYFFGVQYVSGPTAWKGARFHLEENEECQRILKSHFPIGSFSENSLSHLQCFSIDIETGKFQLICRAFEISETNQVSPLAHYIQEKKDEL